MLQPYQPVEAAHHHQQDRPASSESSGGGVGGVGGKGKAGGRRHHRLPCWDYERRARQCLNGGQCFAIQLHNGLRRAGCRSVPATFGGKIRPV